MAWLNQPKAIIESDRSLKEEQTYIQALGILITASKRTRYTTWVRTRYVGCSYDGAKAKQTELQGVTGVEDLEVSAVGGGQYHVVATVKTEGTWSAWSN